MKKIALLLASILVLGILYVIYTGETYGKYHLSPNQSVKLPVSKNTDGIENSTEFVLINKGHLLELTGRRQWNDKYNDLFYDIDKQQILTLAKVNGELEIVDTLQTSLNGITLKQDSVLMDFNDTRTFYVSTKGEFTIEIFNRSNKPIDIEAYVIYR